VNNGRWISDVITGVSASAEETFQCWDVSYTLHNGAYVTSVTDISQTNQTRCLKINSKNREKPNEYFYKQSRKPARKNVIHNNSIKTFTCCLIPFNQTD
jgi:hypothetical protein